MNVIAIDQSGKEEALRLEAIASLRAGQIDPKFLYATPEQAELWKRVFLRHSPTSPINRNPEFVRIYDEAFARMAGETDSSRIFLVGLGGGTGLKEAALCARLMQAGREVVFSAIDISRDLVMEASMKVAGAGAVVERGLICDLAQIAFLSSWLEARAVEAPRLFTFFGLFPNLPPTMVMRLFRALLRPGDAILASAHLVPAEIDDAEAVSVGMAKVLPQYDNPETRDWLAAALKKWQLQDRVTAPEITVGEVEGIPAFVGLAHWTHAEPFERWGERFEPQVSDPLRLFHSLRYTPVRLEALLRGEGFAAQQLAITSCREEAIWCIRRP